MIPKMLIKCVETGGSLMKRMICNACGDKTMRKNELQSLLRR